MMSLMDSQQCSACAGECQGLAVSSSAASPGGEPAHWQPAEPPAMLFLPAYGGEACFGFVLKLGMCKIFAPTVRSAET